MLLAGQGPLDVIQHRFLPLRLFLVRHHRHPPQVLFDRTLALLERLVVLIVADVFQFETLLRSQRRWTVGCFEVTSHLVDGSALGEVAYSGAPSLSLFLLLHLVDLLAPAVVYLLDLVDHALGLLEQILELSLGHGVATLSQLVSVLARGFHSRRWLQGIDSFLWVSLDHSLTGLIEFVALLVGSFTTCSVGGNHFIGVVLGRRHFEVERCVEVVQDFPEQSQTSMAEAASKGVRGYSPALFLVF